MCLVDCLVTTLGSDIGLEWTLGLEVESDWSILDSTVELEEEECGKLTGRISDDLSSEDWSDDLSLRELLMKIEKEFGLSRY